MYNPIYSANNFLMRSFHEKKYISPMKLQKMLYFLYRDYLQKTEKPLFTERFMTWKYGPVLSSVYDEFKRYGGNDITTYGSCDEKIYIINEDSNQEFKDAVRNIWDKCKDLSGIYLSQLTHKSNGAWYRAYQDSNDLLDDKDITNDKIEIA